MNDFTERKKIELHERYWGIQVPSDDELLQARHLAVLARLDAHLESAINELVEDIRIELPAFDDCTHQQVRTLLDSYLTEK